MDLNWIVMDGPRGSCCVASYRSLKRLQMPLFGFCLTRHLSSQFIHLIFECQTVYTYRSLIFSWMLDIAKLSRTVSHALRHEPWLYGLELDSYGSVGLIHLVVSLRRRRNDTLLSLI
jgi:hypothetical protein